MHLGPSALADRVVAAAPGRVVEPCAAHTLPYSLTFARMSASGSSSGSAAACAAAAAAACTACISCAQTGSTPMTTAFSECL